jgi:hypothetical protein
MYYEYLVLLKINFVEGLVRSFIISTIFLLIATFILLFINNVTDKIIRTKQYNH